MRKQRLRPYSPPPDQPREPREHQMPHGIVAATCASRRAPLAPQRPRTARIVLTLALDRLARHYGIELEARGPAHARTRSWQADGARPTMEGS